MSRYFHISSGLRGCYMPDNHWIARVDTRRELRSVVESESNDMRGACGFGGSKRQISAAVAQVWAGYKTQRLDSVVPFGRDRTSRPFGVFIAPASRADYLASQEDSQS